MGVMACNRAGCENVLCDLYSSEFGYICNDCFRELAHRGVMASENIKKFMQTPKEPPAFPGIDVWEYYEGIFVDVGGGE